MASWKTAHLSAGPTCGDDAPAWSKIPRTNSCCPPKQPPAFHSESVTLADDLLESAYHVRQSGNGEKDVAEETKRLQYQKLDDATTWSEWRRAADKIDILEGNFCYKFDEDSDECDLQLIRKRLDRLKQANHDRDIHEMLQQIRHDLKRDLGGMCNPNLYRHSMIGTKHLIEEYTEVVKYTIDTICKHCETADEDEIDRCLEMIKAARQSFGNTALMLSGGGTLGMCHIGVVKTLLETAVLPKVVCGSSAGSIVGSVLCTQKPDVITEKLDELIYGDLGVFQSPDEVQGVPGMALNLLKGEPAFNVANLCHVMRGLLGDITFREAFNFSGMILNIHVSCRDKHNLPRLLNYVTAPNVVIWSAVASSCALPFVFSPPGLKAKDPVTNQLEDWGHADHKWIDGSIEGDLPAQILERLFNVNNFIASQVNPHVIHFLPREGEGQSLLRKGLSATRANAVYVLDGIMHRGCDPFIVKMLRAVLSQKYDGDVTILPNIDWVPLTQILANPSFAFMQRATMEGEKATWPKLDRIHKSVAIELALDRGVRTISVHKLAQPRRPPSTSRSEQGRSLWRSTSSGSGFGKLTIGPRFNRGRPAAQRSARSSIQPRLTLRLAATNFDTLLSSSDETRSGASSPTTDYDEDRACQADDEPSDDDFDSASDERLHMLAFLSQPTSPSISMKTYWGAESHKSPPPTPNMGNVNMRRALKSLHMSSIDATVAMPQNKPGRTQ